MKGIIVHEDLLFHKDKMVEFVKNKRGNYPIKQFLEICLEDAAQGSLKNYIREDTRSAVTSWEAQGYEIGTLSTNRTVTNRLLSFGEAPGYCKLFGMNHYDNNCQPVDSQNFAFLSNAKIVIEAEIKNKRWFDVYFLNEYKDEEFSLGTCNIIHSLQDLELQPLPKKVKTESQLRFPLSTSSDFGDIRETVYYVDKTGLIEAIFDEDIMLPEKTILTAPSRFLKSTNLDSVCKFISILVDGLGNPLSQKNVFDSKNAKIFNGTKAWEGPFNCYFSSRPVISVNFFDVSVDSRKSFRTSFLEIIVVNAFNDHSYLANSTHLRESERLLIQAYCDRKCTDEIYFAKKPLKILARCLTKHFQKVTKNENLKVFFAADEVDFPILRAIGEKKSSDLVSSICTDMRTIISGLTRNNKDVNRALLMSSLNISSYLSGENGCLKHVYYRDERFPIAQYFSFTSEDVNQLLIKFFPEGDVKKIKNFYGGFDSNNMELYNPWSVLHYIQSGSLVPHWSADHVDLFIAAHSYDPVINEIGKLAMGQTSRACFTSKFTPHQIEDLYKMTAFTFKTEEVQEMHVHTFLQYLSGTGIIISSESELENDQSFKILYSPNEENSIRLRAAVKQARYFERRFGLSVASMVDYAKATSEFLEEFDESSGLRM